MRRCGLLVVNEKLSDELILVTGHSCHGDVQGLIRKKDNIQEMCSSKPVCAMSAAKTASHSLDPLHLQYAWADRHSFVMGRQWPGG